MSHPRLRQLVAPTLLLVPSARSVAGDDVGPLVRSLWLIQGYGTAEAVAPENDEHLKGMLAKALGTDNSLTAAEVEGLMDGPTFRALAGDDGRIDAGEARKAVDALVPESRRRLHPRVAAHAEMLTTSFDRIDAPHAKAGRDLAAWIAGNHRAGRPLHVVVVCTGNSRRSILGATMGNVAAAYYGMPEVRFHSGGTAPTAFNRRTIASLKEVGVEVEPTGGEAPRGEPGTPNPAYRVRWGRPGDPDLATTEFSKTYADPSNPQSGFAALMVCGEADAACPFVRGASARISMPYLDPKVYDGGAFEAAKYAERRDDLGRLMLDVMMQVRNRAGRLDTNR